MLENIRLAFQGVFSHKMRSFLTMLGIIIGIAAIIAIVSTIKGTNEQIKKNLVGSGDNLVQVNLSQGDWQISENDGYDLSKIPVITDAMIEEMKKLECISDVCIYHKANIYGEICYKNNTAEGINLIGTDNDYLKLNQYIVCEGRKFLLDDFTQYRNVVILDRNAEYTLFQGESALNQTVEIKGVPFTVIGVVDKQETNEIVINSIDEWYTYYYSDASGCVFVPSSIWPKLYSFDTPYQVIVKADITENMTKAGKNAEDYLNNMIGSDSDVKYKSEDTLQKAKDLQELSNTTNQQLIWIASISLIVGGIGVMNIMLVSVTERTREIGLKKALGARKGVILGQFLTEASVLTSLGGIIGVGVGIGLAYIISKVATIPVAISVPAIIISVVFSMAIGIVFGLIPSIKAANLNPIDALRYE